MSLGNAKRLVVLPDDVDRRTVAKVKVGMISHGVSRYETTHAGKVDAMTRASMDRRLELWVDCMPPELDRFHPRTPARRRDLLGLVLDVGLNRAVLCTEVEWAGHGEDGWDEDLWKVRLFDELDVRDWNPGRCPRCREDRPRMLVQTEEGIWWCKRHATRVWEPIEYVEGTAWQAERMLEVGA